MSCSKMAIENQQVQMELAVLGYEDERFETTVNENFHCLICYNVLREPVMCRNEHYFCRSCITKHLHTNSHKCPTCADELTLDTLSEIPRVVKNILNELIVRCYHYDRGCRERIQLQNLKQHEDECGFKPVNCGNQGCGETVSQRDRTYHENELCEFRRSKCHNCEKINMVLAGVETKIANVEAKMLTTETRTANTEAKIENIATQLTNTNMKIENIEAKLLTIDTRTANTEAKIENIATQLTNTNMKIGNIEAKLLNIDTRTVKTEANIENTTMELTNTNTIIGNINTKILTIDTRTENTEAKMADMATELTKTNTNIGYLGTKTTETARSVRKIRENVENMLTITTATDRNLAVVKRNVQNMEMEMRTMERKIQNIEKIKWDLPAMERKVENTKTTTENIHGNFAGMESKMLIIQKAGASTDKKIIAIIILLVIQFIVIASMIRNIR